MPSHDIFVSYGRLDADKVHPIAHRLEKSGFTVWIDIDGIESGDAFKHNIVRAIEETKVVLFFSSKAANESAWTTKEIAVATYEKKPIIPIHIDNSLYNSQIKLDLIGLDYIDMSAGQLTDALYGRLVRTLQKKCGKDPKTVTLFPMPNEPKKVLPPSNTRKIAKWAAIGVLSILAIFAIIGLSADDPSPEELFEKAEALYNNEKFDEALPLMTQAAEAGHVEAQNYLGIMYNEGYGMEQPNDSIALMWYKNSAEGGDICGQCNLGLYYYQNKNYAAAEYWLEKAAMQGQPDAQFSLGRLYHERDDGRASRSKAYGWLHMAADNNNVTAQTYLAYMYLQDDDTEQSLKYAKLAAEQDYAAAQYLLAVLYKADNNLELCQTWMQRAADNGSEDAKKYFIVHNIK